MSRIRFRAEIILLQKVDSGSSWCQFKPVVLKWCARAHWCALEGGQVRF